jgi:hypothetical protein
MWEAVGTEIVNIKHSVPCLANSNHSQMLSKCMWEGRDYVYETHIGEASNSGYQCLDLIQQKTRSHPMPGICCSCL